MNLVRELAVHSLLLSNEDKILFDIVDDGHSPFDETYRTFCKDHELPYNDSDLTFESLASHGIIKCWDFARDKMCVLGFAFVPLSHLVGETKPGEGKSEGDSVPLVPPGYQTFAQDISNFHKFITKGKELTHEPMHNLSYLSWVPTHGVMPLPGGFLSVTKLHEAFCSVTKKPISREVMLALLRGGGFKTYEYDETVVQGLIQLPLPSQDKFAFTESLREAMAMSDRKRARTFHPLHPMLQYVKQAKRLIQAQANGSAASASAPSGSAAMPAA